VCKESIDKDALRILRVLEIPNDLPKSATSVSRLSDPPAFVLTVEHGRWTRLDRLGEQWSLTLEMLRIGNGHISYCVERIPWTHPALVFLPVASFFLAHCRSTPARLFVGILYPPSSIFVWWAYWRTKSSLTVTPSPG
jgi:hypothetical protein